MDDITSANHKLSLFRINMAFQKSQLRFPGETAKHDLLTVHLLTFTAVTVKYIGVWQF